MNKIGIYLRVSTEEQARIQDGSLVSQKKRLEEYVEGQCRKESGWGKVVDVYCDEAKSGKNMNRPEFQRMLSDIRLGKINLILATELSRLSRSIKDFCEMWEFLKEHETRFITIRENFDTTTASGELMVFNMINFAQFERKQTGERIAANFFSRAQRGLWNGGAMPLGFDRDPKNPGVLVPNKIETQTINLIFKLFLDTGSLHQTCRKLGTMGIKTKSYINRKDENKGGREFTVQSLHNILTNGIYIGVREINKQKADVSSVKASWPAIVEKKIFDQVQKRLQANLRKYKPNEWKTYPYPLTGITICGECGKSLCGKSAHGRSSKHHYYDHQRTLKSDGLGHLHACRIQRVRAEKIEDIVLNSLKTILKEPARINAAIAAYEKLGSDELPGVKTQLKAIQTEIDADKTRVENLVLRVSELPPQVSAELFYTKIQNLTEKISENEKKKHTLESAVSKSSQPKITSIQMKERLERTINALGQAPKEKQRGVFENVLQFVELHPTKVRLGVFAGFEQKNTPEKSSRGSKLSKSNFSNVGSHTFKVGGEGGFAPSSLQTIEINKLQSGPKVKSSKK